MGKCLDLTGMLRGEGTPEVFFSFVSNSAEPWGLEVGNETLRRRKTALSLSSSSSSGSYTSPLSVDHPLLTHQLPEGHGWVFPYLKKNDHLAGARALQKTGLGGEPSVGLRWGIQATSLFCRDASLCLRTGTRRPPFELLPVVPVPTGCLQQIFE